MQIASVLSYMPYVARPSESNGIASTTSPARSSASTSATATPVVGTQPTTTDNPGKTQAPTANENAAQAGGNESSTARAGDTQTSNAPQAEQKNQNDTGNSTTEDDPTAPKGTNGQALAPEDIELLKDLQARDREVRQHELAHQIVGGQFAGGASYTFERGPDGGRYAVAGEVPIDVGAIPGDPQATIEKMRKVRAAALAPAEPSAQDRAIAAQASQTLMAAQLEAALQRREATNGEDTNASPLLTAAPADGKEPKGPMPGESIRAVQAYEAMAPGMSMPTADALRAVA